VNAPKPRPKPAARAENNAAPPAPVGFDAFTLAAVADELRRGLVGARVQKVRQPDGVTVTLACYGQAGAQTLLVNADPKAFRAHLTHVRREGPITPPQFCLLCRKYLTGARVEDVYLPRLDRVLHVVFSTPDGERARLVAELMGRNANVTLVSGAGIVRAVLRPTGSGGGNESERVLRPGTAYDDPPGYGDRVDPLEIARADDPIFRECPTDPVEARGWLTATFAGVGRFAAGEIVARAGDAGGVPQAFVALLDAARAGQFEPHTVADGEGNTVGVWPFEPVSVPAGRRFPRESISVALETLYATLGRRAEASDERRALARALSRETAFREKEIASANATLAEGARADRNEELGNNLLAALYRLEKGRESVAVPDLYSDDGREIEIPLDPKKSPQENAEAYFARARKAREAAAYAETRRAERERELAALTALTQALETGETPEALAAVRAELVALVGAERVATSPAQPGGKARAKPREKAFGGFRVRAFTVGDYTLLVGESADANDYLTTKVAAPTDLWFHARGVPGPHGVLKTGGNPGRVPHPVVVRAAEIVAARTASEKHSSLVPVDVTEKRYVRKPRGAKPGMVRIERERTLDVTPRL
jgi:predicted ribosome quality control (RQC) complex YloA/Tae2 family protein